MAMFEGHGPSTGGAVVAFASQKVFVDPKPWGCGGWSLGRLPGRSILMFKAQSALCVFSLRPNPKIAPGVMRVVKRENGHRGS